MDREADNDAPEGVSVALPIPVPNSDLFNYSATNAVLSFLSRNPYDEPTITQLSSAVGEPRSSVKRAVDTLAQNDLVDDRYDRSTREVQINHDRLSIPDDPYLRIPQPGFRTPVREATKRLQDELERVISIVLYGSVARGEADRRSDIDLWVLVESDRAANQRTANRVKQRLEEISFDGDRYTYDIDVETVNSLPTYTEDLNDVIAGGLILEHGPNFTTVIDLLDVEMENE